MITIGFRYIDEFNNEYEATTKIDPLGENELMLIGQQLNSFLRQVTYHRPNDNIYMEDLTQEEVELVDEYVWKLRNHEEEDGATFGNDDSTESDKEVLF